MPDSNGKTQKRFLRLLFWIRHPTVPGGSLGTQGRARGDALRKVPVQHWHSNRRGEQSRLEDYMKRALMWLTIAGWLVACDEPTEPYPIRIVGPQAPQAPPQGPQAPPPLSYVLSGTVRDESGAALVGAVAEIITGAFASQSAISDAEGHFRFTGVAGDMWLSVSKDGYGRYENAVSVRSDLGIDVRLKKFDPEEDLQLGQTIRSAVSTGAAPCDPIRWDARAPCRPFRFTAPRTGTLFIDIAWMGGPELDATIVNRYGEYVATSQPAGAEAVTMAAVVQAGQTYQIRVNAYYSGQVFTLKAELVGSDP